MPYELVVTAFAKALHHQTLTPAEADAARAAIAAVDPASRPV